MTEDENEKKENTTSGVEIALWVLWGLFAFAVVVFIWLFLYNKKIIDSNLNFIYSRLTEINKNPKTKQIESRLTSIEKKNAIYHHTSETNTGHIKQLREIVEKFHAIMPAT